MNGYITTRDVLLHPGIIVGTFGVRVYLRCLYRIACRDGRATFLECIGSIEAQG
jgi:hypothetical protein